MYIHIHTCTILVSSNLPLSPASIPRMMNTNNKDNELTRINNQPTYINSTNTYFINTYTHKHSNT